ncbi:DJ-1/PfpI family protein [Dysgonomonas macrotermitis]|uniref:DJ-1/PfpI family protein n=1 Tax=Dysgonomonas macrotermitis TaxID=1346286 RepID=UPI0009354973|nr:DJ-1/PfpI family protein [Dysgonomonas macrotermitis]
MPKLYLLYTLTGAPVNGLGLFEYLEAFFENKIEYKTFAISESATIKTNSGITITLDETINNLKGNEAAYDALVFACGDAIISLAENIDKAFWQDAFAVINTFNEQGKLLIGHCAGGLIFDKTGVTKGKKVAGHPYAQTAIANGTPVDSEFVIDSNLYTAQTENTLHLLIPEVVKALK